MENVNITNDGSLAYELNPTERKEVRDRYPKTYWPDPVLEPVWFGRRDHKRMDGVLSVVDQGTFAPEYPTGKQSPLSFAVCSDQYKIIHYEDIVHMVEQSVGQLTEYGKIQICPGTYLGGARIRIGIKFPDMKTEIKKVDAIYPKVEVFSSLDLSTKLRGRFGAFQLKCTNGMGIWKTFKQFAKRHLQNLFLNELGENISEGLALFGEQIDTWKKWTQIQIDPALYEDIWNELPFSSAEREKIEALPEIGTGLVVSKALEGKSLDLWSLNSVLTQFATHEVKSELRRIDLEPSIAKVMDTAFSRSIH